VTSQAYHHHTGAAVVQAKPDNNVNAIMKAAVHKLNDNAADDTKYELDRNEDGSVTDLEMYQQVSLVIVFRRVFQSHKRCSRTLKKFCVLFLCLA